MAFFLFCRGTLFSLFKSIVLWILTNRQAKSRYRPVTTSQNLPMVTLSPNPSLWQLGFLSLQFCLFQSIIWTESYSRKPLESVFFHLSWYAYYAYLHMCIIHPYCYIVRSVFFLFFWGVFHCKNSQFVFPFSTWSAFWLFPGFDYCYKH